MDSLLLRETDSKQRESHRMCPVVAGPLRVRGVMGNREWRALVWIRCWQNGDPAKMPTSQSLESMNMFTHVAKGTLQL